MSGTAGSAAHRSGARFRFLALAVGVGATLGGLYAHFIGCRTGTCPITSSVPNASLYGAFVGLVVGWPGSRRERAGLARSRATSCGRTLRSISRAPGPVRGYKAGRGP